MVGTLVEDISAYNIVVLPLHRGLVSDALGLLPGIALRTGDALHFATALRVSRSAPGQPCYVVVSDKDIRDACDSQRISYFNPEDSKALDLLRSLRGT